MDKNQLLIRLAGTDRFRTVPFEKQSLPEQVLTAIWELEAEVNNGGFDQYYFNRSGDTAFFVVEALERIGARKAARIVREANALFPAGVPPRDRSERQNALVSLDDRAARELERLDEEFFAYPDDLTDLLFSYVCRNAPEIPGTAIMTLDRNASEPPPWPREM